MDQQAHSANLYRALLATEVALFVMASFGLSYTLDDALSLLLNYHSTIWILLTLVLWNIGAWSARRIWAGKTKGLRLSGRFITAWVLIRLGFLISCGIMLAGWLTAATAGWSSASVFLRAAVLLMVASFVFGISSGAFVNSRLAFRRWKQRIVV
jgi:hypothetical protein